MTEHEPLVVCAGILVSDLFVPPLQEIPRPGQLVSITPPLYQSGGCAANTGIDLATLGIPVRVSGRVGDDALGQQVIEELAASGVDTSGISRSTTSVTSQTVVISVAGDDRRFMHCVGANAEYTAAEVAAGAHLLGEPWLTQRHHHVEQHPGTFGSGSIEHRDEL